MRKRTRFMAAVLPIDSWYWESWSTILILREIAPREWANGSPRVALHGDVTSRVELRPVLESFDATNKVPMLLNSDLDLHRAHRFVEKAQLDAALNKNSETKNSDAWEGFRQDFPNTAGYLILSGVGFNSGKTLALVYVEHRCGNECGAAHDYFLQKRDGVWVQYFPRIQ
jgi:hypothetical protein